MESLEQKVRGFIVENFLMGQENDNLSNQDSFLDTGTVDSTGMLELVGFIEETWEVTVADEEMVPENLDSVSNVAAFVERKKGGTVAAEG